MSVQLTPSKRSNTESNGKQKSQKSQLKSYIIRVLCPISKIESIIESISQISEESGAKVQVEETILESNERVIIISSSDLEGKEVNSDESEEVSSNDKDSKSSLQKALLLVYEKILENEDPSSHVFRLIVSSSSKINQISSESGAHINILPKEKLPLSANPSNEVIEVSGEKDGVKKAIELISNDQENLLINSNIAPSRNLLKRVPPFPEDFMSFVLLCSDEKVGGVIGKGGNVIKSLQFETGCEIKVLEKIAESEDRIIVISGPAHLEGRISPVQDAVLHVQTRIIKAAPETKDKNSARIVVSSNQIGCLLGKGGAIIAEMRKSSGAFIRILSKEQIPKCLAENDEVVQINGELEAVQEALIQITGRLQIRTFRDLGPPGPPGPPMFMGRPEFSPPGMYSNPGMGPGPQFHNFGGPHEMHDFHRPGMPHGPIGPNGPMGLPDYLRGPPQRRPGGFGLNNQAIITNTTVEVVVPRIVVPAIYGEDGACLKQIREISDAKITITDPKPGATETLIIISGTPEQTNAAQSLIQAFVIIETEGS